MSLNLVPWLAIDKTLEGPPPLLPRGHWVGDLQQECPVWTHLTREHGSSLKQSILNEPWPTRRHGTSGPSSHMVSILRDRA